MFNNISWQEYISCLLIVTAVYYFFVWLFFYKGRIPVLPGATALRNFSVHSEDEPDEVMTTAQHVMDELRPLFARQRNKNELLFALQLQLKKYHSWEEAGFRETLTAFITSQSESICSIHLSEEDQRVLWL